MYYAMDHVKIAQNHAVIMTMIHCATYKKAAAARFFWNMINII